MDSWLDSRLADLLLASGAIEYGEYTLASGKKSSYYVDIKRAVTRPEILSLMALGMAPYTVGHDRVAGVELGAVPIATAVALQTRLPFVIIRKRAKDHGTRRSYEGELRPGERILLVEDVVTTGSTLLAAIAELRACGALVDRAVAVVDRQEGATEALRAVGVEMAALLSAQDLRSLGGTSK